MNEAVLLLVIGLLVFLFAGSPDVHDLLIQRMSGQCVTEVQP